jgi:hypothetical protein
LLEKAKPIYRNQTHEPKLACYKKIIIRAFAEGDTGPTGDASDKSGIKKKEKVARRLASATGHREKNSAGCFS